MNRIAAVTVIRGEGECKAFVDGIAHKEIEKMNERHKIELEMATNELKATKKHRDDLLQARVEAWKAEELKPVSLFEKIRRAFVNGWCIFWALTHEWGLWEYDGERK